MNIEREREWLRGVYEACKKTDSKYIMLFEEDDFVLKPISILNEEFSMAIHPTAPSPTGRMRPNAIPHQFKEYAEAVGGIGDSFSYASGGGTIFNRTQFIDSYERALVYTQNTLMSFVKQVKYTDGKISYFSMLCN